MERLRTPQKFFARITSCSHQGVRGKTMASLGARRLLETSGCGISRETFLFEKQEETLVIKDGELQVKREELQLKWDGLLLQENGN